MFTCHPHDIVGRTGHFRCVLGATAGSREDRPGAPTRTTPLQTFSSKTLSQPSASSVSHCGSSFWPFLDTLAYPTLLRPLSRKRPPYQVAGFGKRDKLWDARPTLRDALSGRMTSVPYLRVIGSQYDSPGIIRSLPFYLSSRAA